ncbi:MAG: glycoside hydrolase family 5 protein [Bacteroidales bacterium]|nr:glycoside hydrolase family 5 protein [Bacteroidales bacterium]
MKIHALAIATALALCSCAQEETTVQPLKVNGTQLCYADGTPAVFRGVSFGWHNLWPRFYNAGAVKTLKEDWHAPILRAAIGADSHANADNPGCHDGYMGETDFAMEHLYAVIDGAIENGCYVIVDWHSHVLHQEEAKAFFSQVATKYKGVPNVIYELFNEPVCQSFEDSRSYDDLGNPEAMAAYWAKLKAYAEDVISVITSIDDSEPLILMGCPSWDQRIDLPATNPVEYSNLMYTVHFYAATHKQYLRDASAAAIAAGTPVFISECAGCEASGDGPLDMEEWQAWSSWAKENGVSMMTWSISDKKETCSMFTPEAGSEGPWADEVIKEWGKIVKDWLIAE